MHHKRQLHEAIKIGDLGNGVVFLRCSSDSFLDSSSLFSCELKCPQASKQQPVSITVIAASKEASKQDQRGTHNTKE
jgi:hypothetical protein